MGLFRKKEKETEEYLIKEKPFRCTHCGNNKFWYRKALLNTAMAEFFELSWANRQAKCLVCSECRYIHWFLW